MSIVPFKDRKKRNIILQSGKIKEVEISTSIMQIPRSNRTVYNISKALEEVKIEKQEMEGTIEKLERIIELGIDNYSKQRINVLKENIENLNQSIKYKDDEIKRYIFICPSSGETIRLTRCISKRERKDCLRLCTMIKKFIGI